MNFAEQILKNQMFTRYLLFQDIIWTAGVCLVKVLYSLQYQLHKITKFVPLH